MRGRSGISEGQLVDALDHFVLQHRLPGGQTIVERFVAARPDLLPPEREMLLGWRDVVEGVFEVVRREGDVLIATNMLDDLTYRVRSNMGRGVLRRLSPRSLLIARLVPLSSDWLLSGVARPVDSDQRDLVYTIAAQFHDGSSRSRVSQSVEVGARLGDAAERPRAIRTVLRYRHGGDTRHGARRPHAGVRSLLPRRRTVRAWGRAAGCRPRRAVVEYNFPPELVDSGSVALIYEEVDGLGFYGGYDEFERAFTEPAALDQHRCRRRVLEYLHDDTVSPAPFRRMAERDPARVSEVLKRVLSRKSFDWNRDGEDLMRRRKRFFCTRPPLPRTLPISSRLAPYVG